MILTDIQIELSGICNLACSYCAAKTRRVGKGFMDVDLARSLIREAAELKLIEVSYHGMGESTLHPALIELLQYGESLGLSQRLATNCVQYVPELTTLSQTKLILSLHGGTEYWSQCIANAEKYLQTDFSNPLVMPTIVCAEGYRYFVSQVYGRLLPLIEERSKAELHLKQPVTHPDQPPVNGFIPEYESHRQIRKDTIHTPQSIGWFCSTPDFFVEVMADGTTSPCCVAVDDWGLPNAKEGLEVVWTSERMQEIQRMWKESSGNLPCTECQESFY